MTDLAQITPPPIAGGYRGPDAAPTNPPTGGSAISRPGARRRPPVREAGPDPIDVVVGLRIRVRRKTLGLTQGQLADALGLSFQQVQKYERGANRVSASMLVKTARFLGCSVGDLVDEEADHAAQSNSAGELMQGAALEAARAFTAIPAGPRRIAVLQLMRAIAEPGGDEADA